MSGLKQHEEVRITELEPKSGEVKELPPHDRARLTIAAWVLGTLALIFISASIALILIPKTSLEQAKEVFDFVKTSVPPIVTLVIGFYFRSEGS